jgi:hypothetical protein
MLLKIKVSQAYLYTPSERTGSLTDDTDYHRLSFLCKSEKSVRNKKPNRIDPVQECDARNDEKNSNAGNKKINNE